MNRWNCLGILLALLLYTGGIALAQTTQAADKSFDEIEWVVLILDASSGQVNAGAQAGAALPSFVESRRQNDTASTTRPSAIGIIRLLGQSDGDVDVLIKNPGGEFLTSWPKAQYRSRQLLWRNLKLTTHPPDRAMEEIPPGQSLFGDLRQAESDYLSGGRFATERFLLYDVQFSYPSPLEIKREKDSATLHVGNSKSPTLNHLAFYECAKGVWRVGEAGDLKGHKMPATTQAATQTAITPATHAATMAATQPATLPVELHDVQMVDQGASNLAELVKAWEPLLRERGISEPDARVIVASIAAAAMESKKLSAVYLMDSAEFDRLLPLEILPQPGKITRVGIVIVQNIDPNAGSEIDDLIVQLGDPIWSKREAAYKTLLQMGTAPATQLRKAIHNKDPEIAWRAEKLLAIQGLQGDN